MLSIFGGCNLDKNKFNRQFFFNMLYISLKQNSLTKFIAKGKLSELGGSSKYNVFDNEIVIKEKNTKTKYEQKSAKADFLSQLVSDNMSLKVFDRLCVNLFTLIIDSYNSGIENYLVGNSLVQNFDISTAEKYCEIVMQTARIKELFTLYSFYEFDSAESQLRKNLFIENDLERKRTTYRLPNAKNPNRKINKAKVQGKIYALFNLKISRKFIAFYSVSFPINISDNVAFDIWNLWLTHLRKYYGLTNYLWVTERQKNKTIHFHMLTNQFLPIKNVNRTMANIIDNKVKNGLCSWGNSSVSSYNGVDVDSIYNSKRHRKSGKELNPTQVRNWLQKYVTKYVSKNNESFEHLCWHCSRSVSQLFTSTVILFSEREKLTQYLPRNPSLYINFKSDYSNVFIFKFVANQLIFKMINLYNDLIFGAFVPTSFIAYSNNVNPKN